MNLGNLHYQSEQVMIEGEWVERDWLAAMGVVQETLRDGQETILTVLKGTDGSFLDSVQVSQTLGHNPKSSDKSDEI